MYVQIETFDAVGAPKGIPYLNEKSVEVNAENKSINRKVKVEIPVGDSGGSSTTLNQTVSENGTASLSCSSGTIQSISADESNDPCHGNISVHAALGADARLAILGPVDPWHSPDMHPGLRMVYEDEEGLCGCDIKKGLKAET